MKCNCSSSGMCGGCTSAIGRVLLASIFVLAGIMKIIGFASTQSMIASVGLPMPALMTLLAIVVELGAGIMLLVGFHARIAAWMLIVFTAVATVLFHLHPDMVDQMMMLKNIAIIGGLLYVTVLGAGNWSMSGWNSKVCVAGTMCPDCKNTAK